MLIIQLINFSFTYGRDECGQKHEHLSKEEDRAVRHR